MRYERPEINQSPAASEVIRGSGDKSLQLFPDIMNPHSNVATTAAYEADE
ncbi:MAG TPA: hypothetical protein VGU63_00985 [Candidatus Acidoferrales bacterium]|nr:hypothetical protein [Candidatus Acidoferrales bacterium]